MDRSMLFSEIEVRSFPFASTSLPLFHLFKFSVPLYSTAFFKSPFYYRCIVAREKKRVQTLFWNTYIFNDLTYSIDNLNSLTTREGKYSFCPSEWTMVTMHF